MEFEPTELPDVLILCPKVFSDERGFFMETYRSSEFEQAGIPANFVQDNHSSSIQGVLRGLHYQVKQAQGKLVRVIVGEIYDVAVDIRKDSATFGKWVGHKLSAENKLQLWIPPGFAHGFYVLSQWAEVVYKTTDYWSPEWERTLLWDDPEVGIAWPLIKGRIPKLSEKDSKAARLMDIHADDLF
jgi:dTDP-4-dehydrorhamnose 3,5-epimerase